MSILNTKNSYQSTSTSENEPLDKYEEIISQINNSVEDNKYSINNLSEDNNISIPTTDKNENLNNTLPINISNIEPISISENQFKNVITLVISIRILRQCTPYM